SVCSAFRIVDLPSSLGPVSTSRPPESPSNATGSVKQPSSRSLIARIFMPALPCGGPAKTNKVSGGPTTRRQPDRLLHRALWRSAVLRRALNHPPQIPRAQSPRARPAKLFCQRTNETSADLERPVSPLRLPTWRASPFPP